MSWDDPTQGLGVTEDGTDIEGLCRSLPPNSPQQRYIERLVRLGWLTLEVDDTGLVTNTNLFCLSFFVKNN